MTNPSETRDSELVARDRLREILAGCEGVTPGPWRAEAGGEGGARGVFAPQKPDGSSMVIADVYAWPEVVADNAAHIAHLDPQTVASIITELLALREAADTIDSTGEALYITPATLEQVRANPDKEYHYVVVAAKHGPYTVPLYVSPREGHVEVPVERVEAARDVLAERDRQVSEEGWTPSHDDQHDKGEIARAAACYAYGHTDIVEMGRDPNGPFEVAFHRTVWPWDREWWKPTNRRRDLVKAGALILAEIERLDRAALPHNQGETKP